MADHPMMKKRFPMYDSYTLWNPTRARNFVKRFGTPKRTFIENMVWLANTYDPKMHPAVFRFAISPTEFIRKLYPYDKLAWRTATELMGKDAPNPPTGDIQYRINFYNRSFKV
jgi:hypothetical protein